MTNTHNISYMTNTHSISYMTNTHNISYMTNTHKLSCMTNTHKISCMTNTHKTSCMTNTHKTSCMTNTQGSDVGVMNRGILMFVIATCCVCNIKFIPALSQHNAYQTCRSQHNTLSHSYYLREDDTVHKVMQWWVVNSLQHSHITWMVTRVLSDNHLIWNNITKHDTSTHTAYIDLEHSPTWCGVCKGHSAR